MEGAGVTHQAKIEPTPEVLAAKERFRRAALADRRRIKEADKSDAVDWAAKHEPTEAVMVRIDKTRLRQQSTRRKMDARLMDLLTPDLERAADDICAAWRILSQGMGGSIMRYDPPTAKSAADCAESVELHRQRIVDRYIEWGRACANHAVHRSAVMQVVAYGHGLRAVEAGNRKRNGWAKDNLLAGLDLYCRLHRIR